MKVIVAGSRSIVDCSAVAEAIGKSGFAVTEVVSGNARGVDRCGEWYAHQNKLVVRRFPANWNLYGKRAGYLRNVKMAEYADALVAVWDGQSAGTKMMIDIAEETGLKVFVLELVEKPTIKPTKHSDTSLQANSKSS